MSMRPRTPNFIWLPFLFSISAVSWALLLASLGTLAAVIVIPVYQDVRKAEGERNDLQATVALQDQQIQMQGEFISAAGSDPLLMQRLASRQLNLQRKDQETLALGTPNQPGDRSAASLLAESLTPVKAADVSPLPFPGTLFLQPALRSALLTAALAGLGISFMLGVRYERS
jgi:hypothetical protein